MFFLVNELKDEPHQIAIELRARIGNPRRILRTFKQLDHILIFCGQKTIFRRVS